MGKLQFIHTVRVPKHFCPGALSISHGSSALAISVEKFTDASPESDFSVSGQKSARQMTGASPLFTSGILRLPAQAPATRNISRRARRRKPSNRGSARSFRRPRSSHGRTRRSFRGSGGHELKKAQTGLVVRRAFKLHVVLRQNFMSRVFDRAVALDISVDQSA